MIAGKAVKIQYYDGNEWVEIGHVDAEQSLTVNHDYDSEGWQEYLEQHGQSWSIECEIIDIDWDETWLVAYMARMYANEYRN